MAIVDSCMLGMPHQSGAARGCSNFGVRKLSWLVVVSRASDLAEQTCETDFVISRFI